MIARWHHLTPGLPLLMVVIALILLPTGVQAQTGLAQKYVRDSGIANDSDVIFADNFQTGTTSDIAARWSNTKNLAGMSLVPDVPTVSGGTRALQMTATSANDGGHLFKHLTAGYDRVYFRYYVKYTAGTYHHAGGWIGGYNPPTDWPQGGAGTRPTGSDRFTIGAEPRDSNLTFDFYVYWLGMHADASGTNYWGNPFIQDPTLMMSRDRWTCVEVMVKMNDIGTSNGELAVWIDGKPIIHLQPGSPIGHWLMDRFYPDGSGAPFEGFAWRAVPQLNINFVWLEYYVTGTPAGTTGRIWYSDVVVAKSYIGPINAGGAVPVAPTNLRVQ